MPGLSEQDGLTLIALLVALLALIVLLFRRVLDRPMDAAELEALMPGHRDDEYRALARKDGIPDDVARAFETEVKLLGRDIRLKDEEKRRRDLGGHGDGFPSDPF